VLDDHLELHAVAHGLNGPGERGVDHVQVEFTTDDRAVGDAILDSLLADGVVACGQTMGPVVSRYWWDGSLQESEEWMVFLKTRSELAATVIDAIVAQHPYDTPEVVVLPIVDGARGYLEWIDEVTAG
jgi:periplasmic divalent cation tolerance protein